MKFFGFLTLLASVNVIAANFAQASELQTVTSFSVIRTGGGAHEIVVGRANNGTIFGYTKSCYGKDLAPNDQAKSRFVAAGSLAAKAAAVLDNKVTYGERAMMLPVLMTGTWVGLEVSYNYQSEVSNSQDQSAQLNLRNPIVLVNGQVSSVVADVEAAGTAAAAGLCQ